MHICGLVTLAENRGDTAASTSGGSSRLPTGETRRRAWVTAEAMEEWLLEVRFVEDLFGSSMHVELVSKQADNCVFFLLHFLRFLLCIFFCLYASGEKDDSFLSVCFVSPLALESIKTTLSIFRHKALH